MANNIFILIKRDFRRAMNLRTWLIWIALAGMGIFFFSATGGKTKLMNSDQIEFLALFLPHMIFGSWAVLSSYFDLFSSDREHNVLDCSIFPNPSTIITKKRGIRIKPIAKLHIRATLEERATMEIKIPIEA